LSAKNQVFPTIKEEYLQTHKFYLLKMVCFPFLFLISWQENLLVSYFFLNIDIFFLFGYSVYLFSQQFLLNTSGIQYSMVKNLLIN